MVRARAGIAAGLFLAKPAGSAPASAQSGEPMTVEADDLLEWIRPKASIPPQNAVAIQGARTIRGDVLVATYDRVDGHQETVTATGNVSFKDEESDASGGKLIHRIGARDYRVDGPKARVSGARGTITADRTIILDTAEDETDHDSSRRRGLSRLDGPRLCRKPAGGAV